MLITPPFTGAALAAGFGASGRLGDGAGAWFCANAGATIPSIIVKTRVLAVITTVRETDIRISPIRKDLQVQFWLPPLDTRRSGPRFKNLHRNRAVIFCEEAFKLLESKC
jgi:hypothetical protein